MWPVRGRTAGQGMIFGLSAMNRVYNIRRDCPNQQGLNLSQTGKSCTTVVVKDDLY